MIDVNKFKRINDEYGHLVGNQVLQTTATVLNNYFIQNHPSSDLYRYGGDEFLIVYHSLDQQELKKIKQELTQEFQKLDIPYSLTVSIGYSCGNVYSEKTIKKSFKKQIKICINKRIDLFNSFYNINNIRCIKIIYFI